jgi:hypothetical protein
MVYVYMYITDEYSGQITETLFIDLNRKLELQILNKEIKGILNVYLCMYIYIYIYVYIFIYLYMYVYINKYVYIYINIYICINIYRGIKKKKKNATYYIYTCMHVHLYVFLDICI